MGDDNECAVCMEPTDHRLVLCGHNICSVCVTKWTRMGHDTCPLCRGRILLSDKNGDVDDLNIQAQPGRYMGITLRNTLRQRGVVVVNTNPNDLMHQSGIREGIVITHINNTPVNDHQTAIAILNTLTVHENSIVIRTRPPFWTSFTQSVRRMLRPGTMFPRRR